MRKRDSTKMGEKKYERKVGNKEGCTMEERTKNKRKRTSENR